MKSTVKLKNVPKRTYSILIKNKSTLNKIFTFLGTRSKNVYNSTIYISNIYYTYKEEIFKIITNLIDTKIIINETDMYPHIQKTFEYFYNLHSSKNSTINKNTEIIYKSIKSKLNGIVLSDKNYNDIRTKVINETQKLISYSSSKKTVYEFEFIVDRILRSIYCKLFSLTKYQMLNKIPLSINDQYFIEHVKSKQHMFLETESLKKSIKFDAEKRSTDRFGKVRKMIQSDQNIISRFIYNHLGDNKNELPSDIIINVIRKAFDNFSSYWALKQKGIKCNKSKYLRDGELFILPFFKGGFNLNNNTIRLTVGKYVANNFIKISGRKELICINSDEKTEYKKYIPQNLLKCAQKNQKISRLKNYIINVDGVLKYVDKKNTNIINPYYVYLKIPDKIFKKKIKQIEINPIYSGYAFKVNITYDLENYPSYLILPNKKAQIEKDLNSDDEVDKNEKVLSKDNLNKHEKIPKKIKSNKKEKKNIVIDFDNESDNNETNEKVSLKDNLNKHEKVPKKIKRKSNKKEKEYIVIDSDNELNNKSKAVPKKATPNVVPNLKTPSIKEITNDNFRNNVNISKDDCISIDLGVINLMTIYNPTGNQLIIKGNHICSLNHYYNNRLDGFKSLRDTLKNGTCGNKLDLKKVQQKIQKYIYETELKRKHKINDFFNKTVKFLWDNFSEKKAIIVGYNINWKNGVNMGKNNNRKFYGIPYRNLLSKLKDKFGTKLRMTEESYTSKCSAIEMEEITKKQKYEGVRETRGLYVSKNGIINADLNGAINIMRKVVKLNNITGLDIFNPTTINILSYKMIKTNINCDVEKPADIKGNLLIKINRIPKKSLLN
jgi:putative transposase